MFLSLILCLEASAGLTLGVGVVAGVGVIVGVVVLDLHGSGEAIVFKNLASGQLLPVKFDRVDSTNTTATNMVALK
jgi:hypothetical protein